MNVFNEHKTMQHRVMELQEIFGDIILFNKSYMNAYYYYFKLTFKYD